jgi:hypothetical protein
MRRIYLDVTDVVGGHRRGSPPVIVTQQSWEWDELSPDEGRMVRQDVMNWLDAVVCSDFEQRTDARTGSLSWVDRSAS